MAQLFRAMRRDHVTGDVGRDASRDQRGGARDETVDDDRLPVARGLHDHTDQARDFESAYGCERLQGALLNARRIDGKRPANRCSIKGAYNCPLIITRQEI